MAFILVPGRGAELIVNGWNWRPTLSLIRSAGLITEEDYERLGAQGCGGQVDAEVAGRIAAGLERRLATMKPGERMLSDLTITAAPKTDVKFTPHTKSEEIDTNDLYSVSYEWLVTFHDFCNESRGFKVS
jgi:hypothetical protein